MANSKRITKTYSGTLYEGADEFLINQHNPKLTVGVGSSINRELTEFDGKKVEITVTVDIKEIE